ncbi:hypothetical protein ACLB2K_041007 [Fragaria x ananassa]
MAGSKCAMPDNIFDDMNPDEVAKIMEGLRADIARLEGQRVEAAATWQVEAAATWQVEAAATCQVEGARPQVIPLLGARPSRPMVHLGVNLFLDDMQGEGPPPLPEPAGNDSVESLLRAISENVRWLTMRVEDSERKVAHNPPGTGFEERTGPFTRQMATTVRLGTTKPLKLSYSGEYCPYLFLDSFKLQTNAKGYTNAMCCNLFQEALTDEALSWFYELLANSVECF